MDVTVYVAWQTTEKGLTHGEDLDLLLSNYTGTTWTGPWEMTPIHDSKSDAFPLLSVFNGSMHLFWESNDNTTTSGDDWDLVMMDVMSVADRTPVEITPTKDNYDDTGVTKRGFDALEFGDTLYVSWSTTSESFTNGTDKDIVYVPFTISQPASGGDPVDGDEDGGEPADEGTGILLLGIAAAVIAAIVVIVVYYHTKM